MGIVKSTVNIKDLPKLRKDAEALLSIALKNNAIDYSDIPKMTSKERSEWRQLAKEGKTQEFTRKYFEKHRRIEGKKKKKKMFSLRIQDQTLKWWKQTVGKGYTGIMSRLLDEATRHPEWIKKCL